MKRVVSISLGSSKRDHYFETEILGEHFRIERVGTDGSIKKAIELVKQLDGKVDAFGMGGIDMAIRAGNRKYFLREALPIARAARLTPMVDGSGLKETLEYRLIQYVDRTILKLEGKHALLTTAVDRVGMARGLVECKANVIFGDLMFNLGVGIPLRTMTQVEYLARIIAPVVCQMPFSWLYPTGSKQEQRIPKYRNHFLWAEVVCGDFHLTKRFMPDKLPGKIVVTNTVTADDIDFLRAAGVLTVVTGTPEMNGRSFGTNVLEAILVALSGKRPEMLTHEDYFTLLDETGFKPRVVHLRAVGNNTEVMQSRV
ncbi:MAG: quinate 5-dehydrogenase [Bacillota bacterium]